MSDSPDDKTAIALTQVLTLIALFFNLPRGVTTLAHEVIAIAVCACSVLTVRSFSDQSALDTGVGLLAVLVQVLLICTKTLTFRKNKKAFLESDSYKELDRLT
jgi:hypothetical protein